MPTRRLLVQRATRRHASPSSRRPSASTRTCRTSYGSTRCTRSMRPGGLSHVLPRMLSIDPAERRRAEIASELAQPAWFEDAVLASLERARAVVGEAQASYRIAG